MNFQPNKEINICEDSQSENNDELIKLLNNHYIDKNKYIISTLP